MDEITRDLLAQTRKLTGAHRRDRIAPASRGARPDARFRDAFASPAAGRSSVIRASSKTPGIAPRVVNPDNRGQDFKTLDITLSELRREPTSSVARWGAYR